MSVLGSERVRDMLVRAGLDGVPIPVLKRAVVLALVAIGIALWRFWPGPPVEIAVGEQVAELPTGAASEETGTASVVVHVTGAVVRPGVYTLDSGSRVTDVVALAGGLLGSSDAGAVNLARILADGEQVYFPVQGEEPSASGGSPTGGSSTAAGGLVDLNRADAAALDTLPGIGPATAQKIIAEREANGPFSSVEDLMRVPGIGATRVAALADLVVVR